MHHTEDSTDETSQKTVVVRAGEKTSGEPVYEELLVEKNRDGFLLLATPGLVLGVAAGDTFTLDESGRASVLRRGRNLAVQLYGAHSSADELAAKLAPYGARIDARARRLTVLTVPVAIGFPILEGFLNDWSHDVPDGQWFYGNVYDVDGVTPLNWWLGK